MLDSEANSPLIWRITAWLPDPRETVIRLELSSTSKAASSNSTVVPTLLTRNTP